jgi:hypothetical protein
VTKIFFCRRGVADTFERVGDHVKCVRNAVGGLEILVLNRLQFFQFAANLVVVIVVQVKELSLGRIGKGRHFSSSRDYDPVINHTLHDA